MIKYTPSSERRLSLFKTPFEQELDKNNRWVRMAAVVPWDEMARVFFSSMSITQGRGSVDLRHVLGALLVKHVEGLSDEDTLVYIQENIYAQYFVGLSSFQQEALFSPTLFVEIRKRLGKDGAQRLNDMLLVQATQLGAIRHRSRTRTQTKQSDEEPSDPPEAGDQKQQIEVAKPDKAADSPSTSLKPSVPKGTLKLDATVAPQHIGYPTDTALLNQARGLTEGLLDKLYNRYKTEGLWPTKPRTYRRKAQAEYLGFAKQRRPTKRAIKRTRGKQLRYLRRNLKHINQMLDELSQAQKAIPWRFGDWRRFWILQELYRQQDLMHRDGRRRIDDRIVNIAQAYVRPIKRGKAGKQTEFGAKLNMSETEGFVRMDQLSFDNFNEGILLQDQVEKYKDLYGYYPQRVLVDRIYLNRANRQYLKHKGIEHSGIPLGRPRVMSYQQRRKRKQQQRKRSEIEGKFGQAKSKYGLDDIPTRTLQTSYAHIGLILLALNVLKLGKAVFIALFVQTRHALPQLLIPVSYIKSKWA